jgi:lipopolysaccharide/colanic/teichoic acid biosynthesis glycosyltransferase
MENFQLGTSAEEIIRQWQRQVGPAASSPSHRGYRIAKRAADIALSLVVILVLSPLLLLVALIIKLDSEGPAIFAQERVGYDERRRRPRTFAMYKFRTMYHNCDQSLHREYAVEVIRGGTDTDRWRDQNGFLKVTNDPRVTRVGRIFRKTAVDELPQLWNVLKGDMSLVGPRPALPYEVAAYRPHHLRRLGALPGCTGLWQVRGWCRLSFEEMVKLDVEYIERQSLWLDVQILFGTVPAILAHRGGG